MSLFYEKQDTSALIDVRIKLGLLAGLLVLVLTNKGFLFPLIILMLCCAVSFILKVPARRFFIRMAEPLFIIFVLLFLKSLSGKDALFQINFIGLDFYIYKEGFLDGIKLSLRILAAVSAVSVFGFSTPYAEILGGLLWFRIPRPLVEISMFALRYLKSFFEEANVIYGAQKNRLGYSSLRCSLNSFGILAGSLAIKAFDQAQATSTAMVQRGYDGKTACLFKPAKAPGKWELALAGIFISFIFAIWIILP